MLTQLSSLFGDNRSIAPGDLPCFWQTDVHSHLLPGIDDGVKTHEEVLQCLVQMANWGIRHVVTTPHVNEAHYPNKKATLLLGQAALRKLITNYRLPLTVDVAAEYMLDGLFLDLLAADELLCFGRQKYLLVELNSQQPPPNLDTLLFQLQVKGYRPVLAHPERYRYYHENLPALTRLRDFGCLFQLNWGSVTGRYGPAAKQQAMRLLKNEWVDCIGSDLHRASDLYDLETFFVSPGYKLLAKQKLLNVDL